MENKERLEQSIAQVNAIKEKLLSKTIGSATEDRIDIGDFIGTIGGLWKMMLVGSNGDKVGVGRYLDFEKGNIDNVVSADGIVGLSGLSCRVITQSSGDKTIGNASFDMVKQDNQYIIGFYDGDTEWNNIFGQDYVLMYNAQTNILDESVPTGGDFGTIQFVKVQDILLQDVTVTENCVVTHDILNYDGLGKVTVNVASSGGGEFFDRTFANNTPEQISKVSALISYHNMTSAEVAEKFGWNIGDTTKITLSTGEVIEMRIIGFNHDTRTDGGKAGITLDMTHCLAASYKMNDTKKTTGGYPESKMKTETLPTIKATLPQDWQNVIKLVDKKSANGGDSNYTQTITTSEGLFLLSSIEFFGEAGMAKDGENEGVVYEYWNGKSNIDRIKKYDGNGDGTPETNVFWWLRSCSIGSEYGYFCGVSNTGSESGNVSNNYYGTNGVSFAFCV